MTTTRVRLQTGEVRDLVAGNFKVTGASGTESVVLAPATVASIDSKVEAVTLPGEIGSYTFERKGKSLVVKSGGAVVATVSAQFDADGTSIQFADTRVALNVVGRDLELDGRILGRTPVMLTAAGSGDSGDTGGAGATPDKGGPDLSLSEENRPVRISEVSASSFGSSNSTRIGGLDAFRADARFSGIDGSGQTIVILDTSFDLDHPAFGPDADRNGVADRIVYTEDFTNERNGANTRLTLLDDHGTHVASISASQIGDAPGVAPGTNLILLQVLTEDGSGFDNDIEKALQWVVRNGAFYNVVAVNLSLGGSENDGRVTVGSFSDEFSALRQLGIVPVVAAGNDYESYQAQGVSYPASDASALGVSASNNAVDLLASFSQRHATLTDSVAPGQNIIGANSGGGVLALSGTSMATPFVTGTIALAQQLAMQALGRRLTAAEVVQLVNTSGTRFTDREVAGDGVRNSGVDYSHVDVKSLGAAVLALAGGGAPPAPAPGPGPAPTPAPTAAPSPAPPPAPMPIDDAGNDASTSVPLLLGTVRSGSLETVGDRDWYAFEAVAGSTYRVTLDGVSLRDPYLRIVDATGDLVIENDDVASNDLDSQASFIAVRSGRFFAIADAYLNAGSGTYTVLAERVASAAPTPPPPVNGVDTGSVTGSIAASGERDPFNTLLEAGVEYTFRLRGAASGGGTLADPFLSLKDQGGQTLATDDDSGTGLDSQLVFTPAQTGTYVLEAAAFGSGTGSYTIERTSRALVDTARDDVSTRARISDGGTASGRIDFAGDLDWYAVNLQAGRDYTFDLRSTFDNYLTLRDANGFSLATDDDSGDGLNARITFSATESGTYYIEARALSALVASGDYALELRSAVTPVPEVFPGAAPLAAGQPASGNLRSAGETALYQFNVEGGRSYRLAVSTLAGSNPLDDPFVYVFDVAGNSLYDDDSGGNLDALLDFDVFSDGVLAAQVGGFDSGSFSIRLDLLA